MVTMRDVENSRAFQKDTACAECMDEDDNHAFLVEGFRCLHHLNLIVRKLEELMTADKQPEGGSPPKRPIRPPVDDSRLNVIGIAINAALDFDFDYKWSPNTETLMDLLAICLELEERRRRANDVSTQS